MVKVAILADCHLDHGTHRLWADGAWEQATNDIAEGGYEAAVIVGDLFHTGKPIPEAMLRCMAGLRRMTEAGVPVVIVAGNHEWIGVRSMELHRPPTLVFNEMDDVTAVIQPEGIWITPDLWVAALPWPAPGSHASVMTQAEDALFLADEASRIDAPKLMGCHAAVKEAMLWGGSETEMCSASTPTNTVGLKDLDIPDAFSHVSLGHIHNRQNLSQTCSYVGGLEAFTFIDEGRIGAWSSLELIDPTDPSFGWIERKMECGHHQFATVGLADDLSGLEPGTMVRVRILDGESRFGFDESQIGEHGLVFAGWKDERRDAEIDVEMPLLEDEDKPLDMIKLVDRWSQRKRLTEREDALYKDAVTKELGWSASEES